MGAETVTRLIAALIWPVTAALAWLYARYDAKRDAGRQAALEAAEARERALVRRLEINDDLATEPDLVRAARSAGVLRDGE
jgi:hypothetical protein